METASPACFPIVVNTRYVEIPKVAKFQSSWALAVRLGIVYMYMYMQGVSAEMATRLSARRMQAATLAIIGEQSRHVT